MHVCMYVRMYVFPNTIQDALNNFSPSFSSIIKE